MSDKKDYSECEFYFIPEMQRPDNCKHNYGRCLIQDVKQQFHNICQDPVNNNCYYKQLKQAQQENIKLKETVELALSKAPRHCKKTYSKCKSVKCVYRKYCEVVEILRGEQNGNNFINNIWVANNFINM